VFESQQRPFFATTGFGSFNFFYTTPGGGVVKKRLGKTREASINRLQPYFFEESSHEIIRANLGHFIISFMERAFLG
jgi:hypothetical protein